MNAQRNLTHVPVKKKPTKTTHVPTACINCKKAHLACDLSRPCRRCSTLGKSDSCIDIKHKKRGRPKLTSIKKWQHATTLTVNKPCIPPIAALPSSLTPPLHAAASALVPPSSSFKMTASREIIKDKERLPTEMMTMFLSMDLCCARISDESIQFLNTNPTQMGHCSLYDIIHPDSSETLSRLHRIFLDNCHRQVTRPLSFTPASSNTFLTTSAAQLLSIANGSQTIKETLKFKSPSPSFPSLFECQFHLGGGFGGDLFAPNTLNQLYMVCLVTKKTLPAPAPPTLPPPQPNLVENILRQKPDYPFLLYDSDLMSMYQNSSSTSNENDTIQLVNHLYEAIMSPTAGTMELNNVAPSNGYNNSSSCSSEDGDLRQHKHDTVSPITSPATPHTTIQLHPPQQTYSNVLLSDFLEKPMDDLVGDLLQNNVMCRSWNIPAHIAFLREVAVPTSSHAERFMASIDCNPDPLYLNAVKEIKVFDGHLEEYSIKKDQFQTMNFRFSNLVKIHASLTWFRKFDDELAEKFLECCPRFDEFNTNYHTIICSSLQYYTGLYRIRHIASHLQLKRDIFGTPFGEDVIQYLINFPRLKSISMKGFGLNNFQTILQAVHRLSRLTSISMRGAEKDKEHFAEKFLRTKTAEERRQIVKRLSKVKELTWYMSDGFCSNSIMFASKYLTGLNSILMGCSVPENWNNTEQRLFCNKFIDLAASSTNICNARLSMNFMMLSKYLPTAMHRLFSNESTNLKIPSKRKLILSILKEGSIADPTHILVDTSKSITSMDVRVSDTRGFEDFVSQIFKKLTPIHYFKSFDLNFTGKSTYNCKVDVDSYDKLIEGVGSVKKLALDIPVSFKEGSKADYDYSEEFLGDIYPMVEDMTLRATPGVPFDTLLDRYATYISKHEALTSSLFLRHMEHN
ncbi:hypothetical protein [Parasitella parasitica]|uniref:Zn(2)-C6 fungal-type domain-containing protein n=1 Tax=Parasitella parasitica TaxID=35722 RepID=A0A0B7NIC0_9FUNG|nr:hypothetical protein [Parasitella parasitica]